MRKEAGGEDPSRARAARGWSGRGRDPPVDSSDPRLPNFSKSPLPGRWGVLLACLEELGKRSRSPRVLHQRATSALAQCRAWRRIPIASSGARQRQRRAEAKSVIEALILGGLERTLNFDASGAKRQIPGFARLLAAQAAGLACREDPVEFKPDKRGRSRQIFDSILEGACFGDNDSRLIRGYAGVDAGGPPRRIEAHRTAMPHDACAVLLCKWLCPSLLESFNSPDSPDCETVKTGFYFGADPVQWRACLKRMARGRLLRVLPSNAGTQRLASGAFAVAKDHTSQIHWRQSE